MPDGADTIVVGAGSAGAVIAARLTERADEDVLLVEAGPDYPRPDEVPEDLRNGRFNSMTAHDWDLRHRPTPRQVPFHYPRGRVVGGSSAVNTCIALRGQPYDYDEWAELGLPEWSFERCLPAFKRLETDLDVDNEWHGREGPIPIRRHPPHELETWQAAFLEACESLGFPRCDDHNDPTTTGFGPHAMNKLDGERMSTARCYLTPATRGRDNLRLRPHTTVRRIVFEGRRACGLEVETGGRVETLAARRIVLSAGAIGTPGILLRSGVGPRRELDRLGVELVASVPGVGCRILDHPGTAIALAPRPGVYRGGQPLIQTTLRFRSEGGRRNDMQLQATCYLNLPHGPLPMVAITTMVGKPHAAGTIRLSSTDPNARPIIDSRFLEHPVDRAAAVEATELAWLAASSAAMRELAVPVIPPKRELGSRHDIGRWIHKLCGSGYHPCGTVPMGPEDEPEAALDQYGRVRGVDGLLVADASIVPTIPTANTNLTCIMIGERFGQWLRDGTI